MTDPVTVRFPIRGVWFADIIARARGLDVDVLTRAEAVDLLLNIASAYDAVHRVKGQGMHRVVDFTRKRAKLATHLRGGGRVFDAPAKAGVEWHDIINILTQAKPNRLWLWDEAQWDRFEKAVRAAPRPTREMGRTFDLNISTVTRLHKLYRGPPPL